MKKLFILGAGASHRATRPNASYTREVPPATQTPLDRHFTKVLKSIDRTRPNWVQEALSTIKRAWADDEKFENFGLENAILTQSAHMEFFEAIHRHKRKSSISYVDYINSITHLISFHLNRAKEGRERLYEKFIEKYFDEENTINRVITFNYDSVLDKKMMSKFRKQDLYFSNLLSSKNAAKEIGSDNPIMLKLHGSNNWNCAHDDFVKIFTVKQETTRRNIYIDKIFYSNNTPYLRDDYAPCILPPIPSKPITTINLFRFLWTRAYEYLHEAEEIIICGYSLPDLDPLAESLFSNFKNNKLKKVVVVDPDPLVMKKWRRLLSRKNVSKAEWLYFDDFAEFVHASNV